MCAGSAVWCALGTVTVADVATPSIRVAAPAPWWAFVAAVVVAWMIPVVRSRPWTMAPALVSTMPWWPVPMPTSALLWTGPLAWVPVGAACLVAIGSGPIGRLGRALGAHVAGRGARLAGVLTLGLGITTLAVVDPRVPGGDEPHYLVITQSLLRDGDLRIENNHLARDYAAYFGGALRPDYINRGQDGEIYSIHAPGVSALVLPAFAAFGLRGAQVTIVLCLALLGAVVWRLAWRLTDDTAAAWFAWAAVCGSGTTLLLGVMVFPDGPAALATAVGVWLVVELARRDRVVGARPLVMAGTALAALPWLHTRFAILAAGLGLAITWLVWTDTAAGRRVRLRRWSTFALVPAVSAASWFLSFWLIYGTVDPRAPYRGAESIRDWIWGAVVGLFADQQFGVLAFAPVLTAAVAALVLSRGRVQWTATAVSLALVAIYTAAVASYHMWWAGLPGLPARFLTAALPLLAVPLAVAWSRSTSVGRSVLLGLLAMTWAVTGLVIGHDHAAFAFNMRDGQAAWLEWLGPVVNLPRAWPSFFWTTEFAFLTHVALWIGVWVAAWGVLRFALRRLAEWSDGGRLGVAAWVLVSLMVSAEAGWRLTGVSGLDPARSQLAAHAAGADLRIAPWRVGTARDGGLVIRPDEAPLSDRPTGVVLAAGPVPAGRYRVEGTTAADGARVVARIGRSIDPLVEWTWEAGRPFSAELALPAGAAVLVLQTDPISAAAAIRMTVRPVGPALPAGSPAIAMASYPWGQVFFQDAQVFVERDGAWVRGGAEAALSLALPGAAGRTASLPLRNGGARNVVRVTVDGWSQTLTLEPGQEAQVDLPAANTRGEWPVRVRSETGFRPSDTSGDDHRWLGVWIGR